MCRRRHGRLVYDTVIDDKLNENLSIRRSSMGPFFFFCFFLAVCFPLFSCLSIAVAWWLCGCEISYRVSFTSDERCLSGKKCL